jgi:hypothetical protein
MGFLGVAGLLLAQRSEGYIGYISDIPDQI